jgi:hypothetical protein
MNNLAEFHPNDVLFWGHAGALFVGYLFEMVECDKLSYDPARLPETLTVENDRLSIQYSLSISPEDQRIIEKLLVSQGILHVEELDAIRVLHTLNEEQYDSVRNNPEKYAL